MTTLPLRARRLQEARNRLGHLMAQRDGVIERLVKLEAKAKKLCKQIARLEKVPPAKPVPTAPKPTLGESCDAIVSGMLQGQTFEQASDGVPDFLKRAPGDGDRRDAEARAAILAEQETSKRNKARARIEKMKANQSGDRKRMPLQGKAAIAAISQQ